MIQIMIPMADTEFLEPSVVDSIMRQTIPVELHIATRPENPVGRRAGEADSRNALMESIDKFIVPYVFCMDSNVLLESDTIVYRTVTMLQTDRSIGSVHVKTKPVTSRRHFDIGCMAVRVDAIRGMRFASITQGCHCDSVSEKVKGNKFKQVWLSSEQEATKIQ